MQIILSSRGLAALAWVSTFAALWVDAFGLFPNPTRFFVVALFSLVLAILASASASSKK